MYIGLCVLALGFACCTLNTQSQSINQPWQARLVVLLVKIVLVPDAWVGLLWKWKFNGTSVEPQWWEISNSTLMPFLAGQVILLKRRKALVIVIQNMGIRLGQPEIFYLQWSSKLQRRIRDRYETRESGKQCHRYTRKWKANDIVSQWIITLRSPSMIHFRFGKCHPPSPWRRTWKIIRILVWRLERRL